MPDRFDLCGALRRVRRITDLSQRELAAAAGLSTSAVAHAEAGTRDLPVGALARAAAVAGLRVALLDDEGHEVTGMDPAGVRDQGGRRFPAHLDTVLSEDRAWRWEHRPRRRQPTYTFDRRMPWEDAASRVETRPDDHLVPRPGDSPEERSAARAAAGRQRREDERRRSLARALLQPTDPPFTCTCPAACDELDDWTGRPVHADGCPCRCDIA